MCKQNGMSILQHQNSPANGLRETETLVFETGKHPKVFVADDTVDHMHDSFLGACIQALTSSITPLCTLAAKLNE